MRELQFLAKDLKSMHEMNDRCPYKLEMTSVPEKKVDVLDEVDSESHYMAPHTKLYGKLDYSRKIKSMVEQYVKKRLHEPFMSPVLDNIERLEGATAPTNPDREFVCITRKRNPEMHRFVLWTNNELFLVHVNECLKDSVAKDIVTLDLDTKYTLEAVKARQENAGTKEVVDIFDDIIDADKTLDRLLEGKEYDLIFDKLYKGGIGDFMV